MSYGLSGQLERVVTTTQNGSGTVTGRSRVDYRSNTQGIRTISVDWNDANLDGTFAAGERTGSVEYLIDNANFTGYQQTILEVTKNAAGQATKRISYTFGTDEITQTVSTLNASTGVVTATQTQTFGHDGRGSVQVLFDAAAAIAQVYTYSAYGELLAIHNGSAAVVGTVGQANLESLAATNKLYNGEGFDTRTGLYNFRARNYSASLGRFERLDPFAGNATDPFSFNKYGFVHGNPVMGTDPTGRFLSGSMMSAISIGMGWAGAFATVAMAAPEVVAIFGILTWLSIQANLYELFLGLDAQTGEQLSAPRRAMSGVFLLFDFGGGGQIKRVFPKNIPLDDIARFVTRLHLEHSVDAPGSKEAMAAALKFSEEIAENGIKVGGKGVRGADIIAETIDGKLIAREVSVFKGNLNGLYGKVMEEAAQATRGMSQTDLDRLLMRDVVIQLSDEHASNPDIRQKVEQVIMNAEAMYKSYGETLRVKIIDSLGNQIGKL
jgi:RHS repeat-associated protein